ncbi:S-adenosyl-L-methionine-dependent methyltransferase [Nemania sp. FL0916]|nr:S-adenosyl-L-methionine-dependent methyltransferase [Nemania sp. FL0916]
MGSLSPKELSECILYHKEWLDSENNLAAIEHRQHLVKAWGIPSGASVLEIGPGQGELTVVLADAVGRTGKVVAVDNAPLDWGTPDYATAQAHVVASTVGHQISFVQADPIEYLEEGAEGHTFDFIVFGYSIWYFSAPEILTRTLQEALRNVRSVLVAEHSLSASLPAQVPHLLAALTDNALESFRGEESKRNIRCALSPRQITQLAAKAGWALAKEDIITPLAKQSNAKNEVRMVVKSRMFRNDLDDVVSRVDAKIAHMLHSMIDAVAASVDGVPGGLDGARNMDVWIARFDKEVK